jgi:4-diphosphocytidyl-2-methyl-D-erithritol synthase
MHTPKQFIVINDKPIIVHTLEVFNRNSQIDDIVVVLLEGWNAVMERYVEEFNLHKVKYMITGGDTGQESIRNGMLLLSEKYAAEDIIIIHDGVRPLVTDEIINANISGVLLNGNAVTVVPATEALLCTVNGVTAQKTVDRNTTYRTQTPQSLRLGKLRWLHEEAIKQGITNSVATCTLLIELGETVHFAKGNNSNFKITTGPDIQLFEAYLKNRERERTL